MSDTDDGDDSVPDTPEGDPDADDGDDGDGDFDKEAERERLREKYERDQKRREATQKMSDLLLRGATMTNRHCDSCGSPIFRHDGEAFCPNCGGTRGTEGEEADESVEAPDTPSEAADASTEAATGDDGEPAGLTGAADQDATASQEEAANQGRRPAEQADPSRLPRDAGSADVSEGGDRDVTSATGGTGDATPGGDRRVRETVEDRRSRRRDAGDTGPSRGDAPVGGRTGERRTPSMGDSSVSAGEVPSLAQTRASLRRAIVSLSEQAAQSDDPKRAQELLKGSREAAEALAALDGARE